MNEEMKLYKSADCKTSNKNAKTKEMKKETNNLNMCLIERMWGPDRRNGNGSRNSLLFFFDFSCCRNCFLGEWNHKAEAFPYRVDNAKQAEEGFDFELRSSGHGSGKTKSEEPETLEHSQVVGEPEVIDKEMLNRQMEVKGDS
ncbi:LOW QUALITY PROTEIN: hypothetical protein PanWU01x14_141720 [Parasponia andersonii]|uniref:Uncharacterized protein n=1 Tax=Parasponia andersonii TaxID=3476 RepID=A0A2P5CLQ2_PARAD|nr:LOW QUALITY PROTEIN: hypothetical protein PanWU01x14_141720 [Parasponia andersonii]